MAIDLGDLVPLSFQVRNMSGNLVNGGVVALTITQPDGTNVGPFTLSPTTTGIYDYDFTPTQPGRHVARCVSTGANAASLSDVFDVVPADMGSIISLSDAQAALRMVNPSAADVELLRSYVSATTRVVEHYVGPVVPKTYVERLTAVGGTFYLRNAPAISVTSMVTAQGTDLTPLYVLNGPAGLLEPLPQAFGGFFGSFAVEPFYGSTLVGHYANWPTTVTYQAGRIVVPDDILVAAGMILQEFWRSRRAGVSMKSVDTPTDQAQDMGQGLPDDAIALLANYPRVRGIY